MTSKSANRTSRAGWLLLLACLLPTIFVAWQALMATDSRAQQRRLTERQRVLAAIPKDPAVLINVKYRDMPASPDILNWGKRSTKALQRCLADNVDADIRIICAVTLHALGDRRALTTLQAALEDWEPSVRYEVVRALGAMPDESSVEPLLKLYRRKDEESHVKREILRTFASISDKRVVRLLRSELRKDDAAEMQEEVFDALWANRHLMARTTVIGDTLYALRSDNDALVLSATLAAAELRSPRHVQALIPLMEHQWPEVRNKAVYALGKIGDKKATKALLARLPLVRESRMLNNIAFALERLDKAAFYSSIKSVVEHKQAVIRLNAAFVLGDVKHAEGLPMLEAALQDASDYVRTSAIVAVGKLGNTDATQTKRAIEALQAFVSHPNLSVRQEAIYAIHALSKGGRPNLIHDRLFKLDRSKHGDVVLRAALKLAEANDKRARGYVVACLLSYNCSTDQVGDYVAQHADQAISGRLLLAWARGNGHLTSLVSKLNPAGTMPIARASLEDAWGSPGSWATRTSLRVLGTVGDGSVLPLVQRRANARHTWARVHGTVAAARLGDADAAGRLIGEMDNMPSEWLPQYARVAAIVAEPPVRATLDPLLEKKQTVKDVNVALAAAAIRLSWDPDKAIYRFIDGLASTSSYERQLASRYLMRNKAKKVTWLLRRALAREQRDATRDRLRYLLDKRG